MAKISPTYCSYVKTNDFWREALIIQTWFHFMGDRAGAGGTTLATVTEFMACEKGQVNSL